MQLLLPIATLLRAHSSRTLWSFGALLLVASLLLAGVVLLGVGVTSALLLGLAILCAVLAKPDLAILLVVFVLYSNAAAVAVRTYSVPSVIAVSFFILLLLPLYVQVVLRRQPLRIDSVFLLMLAYLAVILASALLSTNPKSSFKFILDYVFEGVVVYFLLINTIRSAAILRRVIWCIVAAAVLLGSIATYKEKTKTYTREYGGFALNQIMTEGGQWDRPVMATDEGDLSIHTATTRIRAAGPFGDPNYFGQILAAALPLACILALSSGMKRFRWVAALAVAPILGAVLITFSRGAALAVLALGVCLLFLRYLKIRYAVLIIAAVAIIVAATPDYMNRIKTLTGLQSNGLRSAESSLQERSAILHAGVKVFLHYPVIGVGAGQSGSYIASYGNLRGGIAAHNTYLQLLIDTGVLGFVCFMLTTGVMLKNLYQVRRRWKDSRPEYADIATALMLSIFVFLMTSIFLHLSYPRYYWLLAGIAGAAVQVYGSKTTEETGREFAAPLSTRTQGSSAGKLGKVNA